MMYRNTHSTRLHIIYYLAKIKKKKSEPSFPFTYITKNFPIIGSGFSLINSCLILFYTLLDTIFIFY